MGNNLSAAHHTYGMCSVEPYTPPVLPLPASQCSLMQTVPAPEGVTCGFLGYLSRPNVVADWPVPHDDVNPQTTCIKACWDLETCGALSYDQDTRQCLLYGESIMDMKPRKSKTGARFFEPDCFFQTCEISEGVERSETLSELDSPLADLRLRHCGLEETIILTDPEYEYDEHTFFGVDLPFPVQLYGSSSDTLYMSINGHLSFTSPLMTQPESHVLPHFPAIFRAEASDNMPSSNGGLPENSLCALWTPQQIVNHLTPAQTSSHAAAHQLPFQQQSTYGSRPQRAIKREPSPELEMEAGLAEFGMRYTVSGEEGKRKATFTWKTSKKGDASEVYDYDILYREEVPGVWMMRYRSVGTAARMATIGTQSTQANARFVQYQSESTPVVDGMTLVLHSPSNTFRRVRRTVTSKGGLKR